MEVEEWKNRRRVPCGFLSLCMYNIKEYLSQEPVIMKKQPIKSYKYLEDILSDT